MRSPTFTTLLCTVAAALASTGCAPYVLEGRVVPGELSEVAFVSPDDPRLQEPGLSGVRIEVWRDPGRGNQRVVASASSSASGDVRMPLEQFGAGWMEEEWLIRATRYQHRSAEWLGTLLDEREVRLLVTLAPGPAGMLDSSREDLMQQYQRFR